MVLPSQYTATRQVDVIMKLFVVCQHCIHLFPVFCSVSMDAYLLVYKEGSQCVGKVIVAADDFMLPLCCALVTVLLGGLSFCLVL